MTSHSKEQQAKYAVWKFVLAPENHDVGVYVMKMYFSTFVLKNVVKNKTRSKLKPIKIDGLSLRAFALYERGAIQTKQRLVCCSVCDDVVKHGVPEFDIMFAPPPSATGSPSYALHNRFLEDCAECRQHVTLKGFVGGYDDDDNVNDEESVIIEFDKSCNLISPYNQTKTVACAFKSNM